MEYGIEDGRVRTRALEYHIADHCNLRCDHCCSFSPILKKWFADPDEFERDLSAVGRVVRPEFVKIVGGEPLLHPQLERLLIIAKSLAVGPRIQFRHGGDGSRETLLVPKGVIILDSLGSEPQIRLA